MDKSGIRIGYASEEKIIVFIRVIELYTISLENCKSIIIIKTIRANRDDFILSFLIVPRKKIIDNWIT